MNRYLPATRLAFSIYKYFKYIALQKIKNIASNFLINTDQIKLAYRFLFQIFFGIFSITVCIKVISIHTYFISFINRSFSYLYFRTVFYLSIFNMIKCGIINWLTIRKNIFVAVVITRVIFCYLNN